MPLGSEGNANMLVTVATTNATLLKRLTQTFEEPAGYLAAFVRGVICAVTSLH